MNPTLKEKNNYGELGAYELNAGKHRSIITRFGGQLIAWEYDGVPILFENERADKSGKTPYRGGAPLCFTYFGDGKFIDGQKHTPSHGEARTTLWSIPTIEKLEDAHTISIDTSVNSITGIPLEIRVTYSFKDNCLEVTFGIENTGLYPSPFQLAFHSYFQGDPSAAKVSGIGEKYLDANDEFKSKLGGLGLESSTQVNRIYSSPNPEINLKMDNFTLNILNSGFPEVVVWNPGKNHTFKDLGDPNFLCVESGLILNPVTLNPHTKWSGRIVYSLTFP